MDQVVDLTVDQERCTKRLAQNATKNAKSLLSLERIVRYIARIVFQSARTKIVKSEPNGEMKRRSNHGR